jgi:acetyl esterase/lipase
MPLQIDPQIARALTPATSPPPAAGDWKARRDGAAADFAAYDALRPVPAGVTAQDYRMTTADGAEVLLRWYTKDAPAGPAVLYLHGGSMILGSVDLYDGVFRAYVSASGIPMLAVDYRLAPEHPFPAPVEDCYAGLVWLAGHAGELGVDPGRIAVMGDSAGGGLSAALTLLARDRGGPAIARQILLYPMLDDRPPAVDPALAEATFTHDDNTTGWDAYLGDPDTRSDQVSQAAPASARDLIGLPPLYLDVGQVDILCAQDIDYARRISDAGIPVELHVHPGANHAFELLAPSADVSRRAMADRVRVLQSL